MRRLLIIVPLALILLVAVVVAVMASRVDSYRPQIQAQLQNKLGRKVSLGHLGLKLFPFSVRVSGFTIQESPQFPSTRPFAAAEDVAVSVRLLSLLGSNPEVKALILTQPKIELIRNAQGVWNYSTLGNNSGSKSDSSFELGELKLDDGQIGYTDLLTKENRSVYDHIDLDLTDFAPKKQFGLELGAHLPGNGKQLLSFKGKVGPLDPQSAATTPVKGHITSQELTLSSFNRFAPGTLPAGNDAVATTEADISTENQTVLCKGSLKLTDAVVHGSKLDFPISTRYDLTYNRASGLLELRSTSVGLGSTSFNLAGNYNTTAKPSTFDMHVTTQNSSIAEMARLAGALGVAFDPGYQVKGSLSADVKATGSSAAPQLKGTLDAKNLQVSGGQIHQPVSVPEMQLALSPQEVRSNSFHLQSGSTGLEVQFAMAQYQSANRTLDATAKTSGANIAELLDMAKAYGVDTSKDMSASGKLNLNLHVQGPLANYSKLAFAGNADITGANLTSPRLTKPVGIGNANVQFAQNSVSVKGLKASIGTSNFSGDFSARNFAAPQVQFALAADKIDTAELSGLSKPAAPAPNQKAAPSAKTAGNSESLIDTVTGSGTLAANSIKAQNILLSNVRASVKLDRGMIQLSPVTADLFGGKESGTIGLNLRPQTPTVALNTKLSGVDSNALLTAVSSLKDTLTGSLAATSNVQFALANSSEELARTLNGTVGFDVTNGHLKNVNILNEVSKVGKFLKSAPTQTAAGTNLKKLSGTMNIANGVANTNDLTAGLDEGSLSGKGLVNLVNQALDMHVTAVLGSGVSQTVGGSGIGGYLNTALANNKGELVLPVIVTGTMSHPVFTPDVQSLAKMKLNNLLPTSGDPTKLTSGIVGAVAGKQGASGILNSVLGGGAQKQGDKKPDANQQQQDNPVNSILQQFGKKKPKQ